MKSNLRLMFFSVVAVAMPTAVQAVPVTVEGEFTGGLYGAFNLQYASAPAGLQLQSIKFDLPSPLYIDPTFAPPGALLPLPFLVSGGAEQTGFAGITGAVDGSQSFTLLFSHFDVGESFNFQLDIDGPCGGFLCTPGAITLGSEFAGTTITAIFGGNAHETTTLVASFSSTGPLTAHASLNGDVTATPEPATIGLLGASLVLLGIYRKRRQQIHP